MAQIRNRFDIQNSIEEEKTMTEEKKLPNFFIPTDDLTLFYGISLSLVFHFIFAVIFFIIANLLGIALSNLPKPELPKKDIEFKLVQNESKPPINKKTKIRSDRDSQAGGKHDPRKPISEPAPQAKKAAAQKPAPQQKPQVQKTASKPQVQPVKPQQKPQQKPQVQKPVVAQKPAAPTPVKAPGAPSVKPIVKPVGAQKPTAPKIATAPKSPFTVAVPPTKGPIGTTYKPAGTPGGSSGSSAGKGTAAPAPKFTSSGSGTGSAGGSSAGKYASRGSLGGYGNGGNPSPGNPHGTPGIDAIRQPNWGPYMRDLEQRIKRNWTPPKNDTSKRVVITFVIGRDGRLLSRKITKSSGIASVDNAAMSAVQLTAPFRPLPPEFKGQSVPIEFTFDYNVLNSVLR